MEVERENAPLEEKEEGYVPRPAWQVWGARVGLVLFCILVVLQILHMAGGLR